MDTGIPETTKADIENSSDSSSSEGSPERAPKVVNPVDEKRAPSPVAPKPKAPHRAKAAKGKAPPPKPERVQLPGRERKRPRTRSRHSRRERSRRARSKEGNYHRELLLPLPESGQQGREQRRALANGLHRRPPLRATNGFLLTL